MPSSLGRFRSGNIMSLEKFTLLLLTTIAFCFESVNGDLKCELFWKSNGFGNYPKDALFVGEKSIGRVNVDGKWYLGSLNTVHGKVSILLDGNIQEFSTYQILTNPSNCTIQWIRSCRGDLPPHALSVDTSVVRPIFIGKNEIEGWEEIGQIEAGEIQFVHKSKIGSDTCYNALVSIYPKLVARFSDFEFELDHVSIRDNSHVELVGRQGLKHTVNDVGLTTTILHSRVYKEIFELEEEFRFTEIGDIVLDMDLWFGESGLQNEQQILSGGPSKLKVSRIREIVISRNIALSQMTDLQVCSTMDVLNNFPIAYKAIARFSLPLMSATHVSAVLHATGRTSSPLESDDVTVTVAVQGSLSGKYVIATTSETGAIDKAGLCTSVLS